MDGLDLLKTFREVATRGSFSRAAATLGVSKATASKYVVQLESRFGVRLLNRSTRSVSLTDAGQLLLERCRPLLELVELTENELEDYVGHPRGRLRIAAPHGLAHTTLPTAIGEFMAKYPDVHVSLDLGNRIVDLVAEGVDMAVRFGRIANESLIVRRLLAVELVVCGAPAYWAGRGLPQKPDDMRRHDVLTYSLAGPSPSLPFEVDGEPPRLCANSRLSSMRDTARIRRDVTSARLSSGHITANAPSSVGDMASRCTFSVRLTVRAASSSTSRQCTSWSFASLRRLTSSFNAARRRRPATTS